MSQSSGKVKPEDLFQSLAVIKKESTKTKSVGEQFFERFSSRFTEKETVKALETNYD
jgi:hypothetical protein